MDDRIKQLKSKRFQLRDKLSQWDKNNKDYDKGLQLAIEYNTIIDELKQLGFNAESKVEYVTTKYWENKLNSKDTRVIEKKSTNIDSLNKGVPLETYLKETITNTIRQEFKTFKDKDPITNAYTLTIAWTNDPADPIDLGYLTHYLEEFNVKCTQPISINQITMNKEEEFMLKYEYNGNEYEHNILKKSIQYILDNLYTKTEIGFFSKKIR